MIPLFLVLAFQSSSHNAVSPRAGDTGSFLYHACQAEIRVIDSPTGGESVDKAQQPFCYAYIQGFVDGTNAEGKSFCLQSATAETVTRVYIAYMEKNPKLFDLYKAEGVFRALSDAYPCNAGR
jgi:Rap1a immunity proteins